MSWWGGKGEQKAQIKRIALKKVLKEIKNPKLSLALFYHRTLAFPLRLYLP